MKSNIITDIDELKDVVKYFLEQDAFAFDVETIGEHRGMPHANTVAWIGIATEGMTKVIPMGHPNGSVLISKATRKLNKETKKFRMIDAVYDAPPEQLRPSQVFNALTPMFFSPEITKVAHNMSFDFATIYKYYGDLPVLPWSDTIVTQWLLDENMKRYNLKDLVNRFYKVDYDQEGVGKKIELWSFDKVAHYQFMDAKYAWLRYKDNIKKLKEQDLMGIYKIEQEVMPCLAEVRLTGATVDFDSLVELHGELEDKIVEIESRIYKEAGKQFNINSNPQKQQILFGPKSQGGQGLKAWKKTKTGAPSCDTDSLESFPDNPVASALVEYATVGKLQTSFVEPYLGTDDKEALLFDNKLYPEFVQYGTVTGRQSCRRPNLQQVPRPDTPLGKRIRNLFIPPVGHSLIVADWGQVELLIIAHYSKDPALFEAFTKGQDPHSMTAKVLFNLPCEVNEVKNKYPNQRQIAKTINFAIAFGAGDKKLAVSAGVSLDEAKNFSEMHRVEFKDIYKFKRDTIAACRSRKPPYVETLLGRKRRLPGINAREEKIRWANERQAVNSRIQGTQADLMKIAMSSFYKMTKQTEPGINLSLIVHDEQVVTCPDDRIEEGVELVRNAMTGTEVQQYLSLPLKLDLKVVKEWGSAK